MLGLKLIHFSKRGHWGRGTWYRHIFSEDMYIYNDINVHIDLSKGNPYRWIILALVSHCHNCIHMIYICVTVSEIFMHTPFTKCFATCKLLQNDTPHEEEWLSTFAWQSSSLIPQMRMIYWIANSFCNLKYAVVCKWQNFTMFSVRQYLAQQSLNLITLYFLICTF